MIRILQIRETPMSKGAGVDSNCQGLIALFKNDPDIEMLPTVDYTKHRAKIIRQYWLDKKEIVDSIKKYNPDIVHVHGACSFTLPIAVKCAKKMGKLVVLSGHLHPFYSLRNPFLGKLFFHLITRRVLKSVDLVYTINNEDTLLLSKYHDNVVKIPHWSKFKVDNNTIEKKTNMILFVGRLSDSNKGFEHLYHLPEGKYEIHCVGKGDIQLRSDMIKHTDISEDKLKRLYLESSLLVVPSRYEAFSYATIEALMCNTPVVLSDRVRIADYLSGISGYSVFTYQDYQGFEEAVSSTIGTVVERSKVEDTFNPEVIKEGYRKAYLSVLTGNRM